MLNERYQERTSYNPTRKTTSPGGVAERTNALVLKTRGGKTPVGSNPTAPVLSSPQYLVDAPFARVNFVRKS
jgi:hypothetical protein